MIFKPRTWWTNLFSHDNYSYKSTHKLSFPLHPFHLPFLLSLFKCFPPSYSTATVLNKFNNGGSSTLLRAYKLLQWWSCSNSGEKVLVFSDSARAFSILLCQQQPQTTAGTSCRNENQSRRHSGDHRIYHDLRLLYFCWPKKKNRVFYIIFLRTQLTVI